MAYSLAVYGNDAFREFILPPTKNVDFALKLTRRVFGFSGDVTVNFENVDGRWILSGTSGPARIRRAGVQPGDELKLGDLIHVREQEKTVDILVLELDQSLNRFKKYMVANPCRLVVGSSDRCDIVYNFQVLVSGTHAILDVQNGRCIVSDQSRNGIYMNSRRIQSGQELHFGDQINIFGLQILWLGNVLAVGTTGQPVKVTERLLRPLESSNELYPHGYRQLGSSPRQLFHRSPRMLPKLNTEPIEIEAVPQPNRSAKRPLLLAIGPSMTMVIPMLLGSLMAILASSSTGGKVSPYMYTGIVIAAAAAAIGVMWALINLRYNKKQEAEAEENRIYRYQNYLLEIEAEIQTKFQENQKILEASYPPASVCAKYDAFCPTLWNRNASHEDMLFVRLGVGDTEFQCPIVIPKKRFSLYDDTLADQPQLLQETYRILRGVPVGLDLRDCTLLGIVGDGNADSALSISRIIAVQLAANCCYTDVKLVFLGNESTLQSGGAWSFARWLPHVWSESKTTRYCAGTDSERTEICYELSELLRTRSEMAKVAAKEGENTDAAKQTHFVVFLEDPELLSGEGLLKQLLLADKGAGVTTLILAPRREMLPNVCEDIIETNGIRGSSYNLSIGITGGREINFDTISAVEAERFARTVSRIEVAEVERNGAIPDAVTFLDMWGVKTLEELHVSDRWRKNRTYETMRALIGKRAGNEDWYLDIHEKHHGPHGLVAGTTGSGKSETLQTFILSLALCYSPDDVAFFIIDYKGGGMANLFENLPHMAGQISNLSGNQVHRAMVSIMSENRRRQRLFNECGVNHIDHYTRLYKNGETAIPLPHLLIIIDEFAELKKEESSFMRELISVAQVGRSLGVHLILATQKPSGTVDDNIWSNAKFRICLRVQDRQDSNEMLHKPDAAYITHAGRGFMQVGNDEIYEEFQSGWSGADYDEDLALINTSIASMHTVTGKPALIGNHLKKQQKDLQRMRWLKSLAAETMAAAKDAGCDLTREIPDRHSLNRIVDGIYARLGQKHVDYSRGRGNTLRLETFTLALAEAARSGAEEDAILDTAVRTIWAENGKLPELKVRTQLKAVVDYLALIAEENGYDRMFRLWLPVLPEVLYLQQLQGYSEGCFDGSGWRERDSGALEALIGLSDNPANQIQLPYAINFAEGGNLAVCGVAGSGKSTFMQSMLFSLADHYSPDALNLYILDFSNRSLGVFENLPHCGGVVYDNEPEKLARFFNLLDQLVQTRKEVLRGGTFLQYLQSRAGKIPALMVVIDNYAGFREKTDGRYETKLQTLAREGTNYGIYLAITADGFGGGDIPNRLADHLRTTVALEMGDRYKYADVLRTIHFDTMPESGVKGRGIAPVQGTILEFQTALPLAAADDFQRTEQIRAYFDRMTAAWKGSVPKPIPEIPADPTLDKLEQSEEYLSAAASGQRLPFGYYLENASICSIELRETFCYLITGRPKTGKSNLLQLLFHAAARSGGSCWVAEFTLQRLKKSADALGLGYLHDTESMFSFTRSLQADFLARNKEKRSMLQNGAEEDEIFTAMRAHKPLFLFIDDLADFIQAVYDTDAAYNGVRAFWENAAEKGSLHHIYIIACVDHTQVTRLSGKKLYETMASYKTGIHLGGNVSQQKILDFSAMPFAEQSKQLKPGIGLLPQDLEHPQPRRVVIPKVNK